VNETRQRFLRAIAAQVDPERIEAVHLFRALRNAGRETGVAVVAASDPSAGLSDAGSPRLTVFTARYRLTLKGPDRGKWEVDVTAEAEAPLAALDDVVRGVQRRSGEDDDADRLTGEAFRDALAVPWLSPG
jgi:hypothetical protein